MDPFDVNDLDAPLGLADRNEDPVPGLDDARLESLLERALRGDVQPDPGLLPPGSEAAPFGEADGAGDSGGWRPEPDDDVPGKAQAAEADPAPPAGPDAPHGELPHAGPEFDGGEAADGSWNVDL